MIVVTGLENSGTSVMSRIVETSGLDVLHMAMPHVELGAEMWWTPEWLFEVLSLERTTTAFIVMQRDERHRRQSVKRRHPNSDDCVVKERMKQGLERLDLFFPPDDLTLVIRYEEFVKNPQETVLDLSDFLGTKVEIPPGLVIYDGNAKNVTLAE